MKRRLTIMERRAEAACAEFKQYNGGHFRVDWTPSKTWGRCARVLYRGDKAAHAGGCGYDKLSAVVASFLSPLAPGQDLGHGAGINTVIDNLAKAGWKLTHDYDAKWEDGFTLSRIE